MDQDATPIDHLKPLFTKSEYARVWDVSLRTVDGWIASGLVSVVRRRRVVRIINDLASRSDRQMPSRGEADARLA